jgi:Niemann-Pick C1 protein
MYDEGTPTKSYAVKSMNWLNDKSGFPIAPRTTVFIFHADGDFTKVLTKDFIRKSFAPLDAVRNLPDYKTICARFLTADQTTICDITGITQFWNHSVSIFDATVQTDQDVLDALAQDFFPDGTPVALNALVGNLRYDDQNNIIGAQSFTVIMDFPEDGDDSTVMEDFEEKVLDKIFAVQKELERDEDTFRFESIVDRSFPDEFDRAIINDIPLVPIVFVIMGMFTSAIFYKKDRVQSRTTLGFMAVVSILLSILAGYGLMFVCGVPFSKFSSAFLSSMLEPSLLTQSDNNTASMTQILPYVFFGVGLDDTFIITGCYYRMDPKRDVVERVGETMEEIGLSIFLTTLTSCLAFGLSCISSIPAVFWLCIYSVPTMVLVLLWQLTFFVACLAIDEQRVAAGKGDGLRRFIHCGGQPAAADESAAQTTMEAQASTVDRYMVHYAHFILKPVIRVIVIFGFLGLSIACGFSTAELEQAFKTTEVLPAGSYITEFVNALKAYMESSFVYPGVYFRNEDQSDPAVRAQMETFVNELVVDVAAAANKQPDFCWFRDFDKFVADDAGSNLANQTFVEQLDAFLANDVYNKLYREDIVLDDQSGSILASRCTLSLDHLDVEDVVVQIDALKEQLAVTKRQPINEGKSEFSFFTYESSK